MHVKKDPAYLTELHSANDTGLDEWQRNPAVDFFATYAPTEWIS